MSKLLNALLLFFAALMIAAVGFGDPGAISHKVNDFFGWKPNKPVDAHIVNVKQAAEICGLSRQNIEDIFWGNASRALGLESTESAKAVST